MQRIWAYIPSPVRTITTMIIHSANHNYATEFYFNFKDSICGELQDSLNSGGRIIPHQHFLATLLLPCGKVDGKIRKFTGNDNAGTTPDDLTKAIHAFAHYSLLYSQQHILFCDLQGWSHLGNSKFCKLTSGFRSIGFERCHVFN